MSLTLIDTHCHLESDSFRADLDEVMLRARAAGVVRMLTIGINAASSRAVVLLANRHDCLSAIVGIHPNHTHEVQPGDWEQIEQLARHPQVVGIGETGLDFYWKDAPLDAQKDYFLRHIQLARSCGKPFVVHCREAEQQVVEVLNQCAADGPLSGVMHSFCGTPETAKACVELGLHISFSGMLTYKKNDELRSTAAQIPLDRLLIETDAPYLAPQPYRGKRNEPAWVAVTNSCLAEVHGVDPETMARQTTANAHRLFFHRQTAAQPTVE
ncbi:MAG: putative deoxyribonuclease YcfH [Planctomycetota bacterium]|jgi:TatD DNase family protein